MAAATVTTTCPYSPASIQEAIDMIYGAFEIVDNIKTRSRSLQTECWGK